MTARLLLENVSVDLPVFGARAVSLKQTIAAAATGGRIGREANVTIVQALSDVCLDLRAGDRLGLVGHNGAGKSTLLRTMAGVYSPSRGRCHREGSVASLIDPLLGAEMDASGYENILLRGLIMGMSRSEIRRRQADIAEFSGLGDYLAMPMRTYSTGMMMRLGFSIATAVQHDILLMDEWMAVGDIEFRERAEERLARLVADSGILVLASHSTDLIARECTMVAEMSHGAIQRLERIVAAGAAVEPDDPVVPSRADGT